MAARKAEGFNVTDACDAAEVSRSAFYAWQSRGEGPTVAEWDEALLINQIRDLHAGSDGTYGEPRMTVELGEGSRPAAGVTVTPGAVPVGDVRRRVRHRVGGRVRGAPSCAPGRMTALDPATRGGRSIAV